MESSNYSPSYGEEPSEKKSRSKLFQIMLILVLLLIFGLEIGYIIYKERKAPSVVNISQVEPGVITPSQEKDKGISAFSDEADFRNYLASVDDLFNYYGMVGLRRATTGMDMVFEESMAMPEAVGFGMADDGAMEKSVSVDRVSETNVQVQGIDEPDIVKTDGKQIYYSSNFYSDEPLPIFEEAKKMDAEYLRYGGYTELVQVINALPVEELGLETSLTEYGELLLSDGVLMVFDYDNVKAFDISDFAEIKELWMLEYDDKSSYVGARLYGDKVYLTTNTYVNEYTSCPIAAFQRGEDKIMIDCGQIYRPNTPIAVDTTYNLSVLDVKTGSVDNSVSFVGSSSYSEMYMSANNIYISYYAPGDFLQILLGMFEEAEDIFPTDVISQLRKVASYDISNEAKMTELESIMEKYMLSLDSDEEMRIENELENRMDSYVEKNVRGFEETGIVKIGVQDLKIVANGFVPGTLLNQFSMDEYDNNLRVATTSGGRNSFLSSDYSVNDVYVLDKAMNVVGSVLDMGKEERIYSVRFLSDKGYVVTFRETDPFYVLDLSKPKKPELKGELKIPGYSSYLHPISKDKILGFGREDSNVKISLFDVSDPENPIESDKYELKEYWSDILNTHHAFLMDEKYNIFFLPGSNGGYIFSYENDKLALKKAVSDIYAQRALFINDYLYVLGDKKVVVLDEKTWERVNEIEFK